LKREKRKAITPKSPDPIQNHDIVCAGVLSPPKAVEIVRVNYWELCMDIMTYLFTGSQKAFFANSGEASSSNVDVLPLHDSTAEGEVTTSKLEIRVAGW
jgi:hypothetical protein